MLHEHQSKAAADELMALGRLTFEELGRGVRGIGDIHAAVAKRVFDRVGGQAAPARVIHDAVAGGLYRGLGSGTASFGRVAGQALAARGRVSDRTPSSTPLGGGLIGALNGLIGDELEQSGSALQGPMSVRVDGWAVPCTRSDVAQAFPGATRRLVVFVHGLMGTEFPWDWYAGESGETYGSRLVRDLAVTPVYVRYNTGRHISENGQSLADLLEELLAVWPVECDEVALVGHSMGGLVARSACYRASEDGLAWVRRVRHVISLGTPHMGAPLAQAVHYASAGLALVPETRPVAGFLRRRSGGIRDLRQGSLVDEDWRDCDPDALRARACREIPLLEGATHCFIAATIMRQEHHPLSRLIGDVLVLAPSASGRSRSRRIPFEAEFGMHLGPAHHLALLNHPAVYARLREWLATPPATLAREMAAADSA